MNSAVNACVILFGFVILAITVIALLLWLVCLAMGLL